MDDFSKGDRSKFLNEREIFLSESVNLKNADGLDVPDKPVPDRTSPTLLDIDMDIPVDLEIRLKKTKAQKRKFVPLIKNHAKRKRPKQ